MHHHQIIAFLSVALTAYTSAAPVSSSSLHSVDARSVSDDATELVERSEISFEEELEQRTAPPSTPPGKRPGSTTNLSTGGQAIDKTGATSGGKPGRTVGKGSGKGMKGKKGKGRKRRTKSGRLVKNAYNTLRKPGKGRYSGYAKGGLRRQGLRGTGTGTGKRSGKGRTGSLKYGKKGNFKPSAKPKTRGTTSTGWDTGRGAANRVPPNARGTRTPA